MRIKKVQLKQFKRFDDLTINLGEDSKKIVILVGPNGCGKSSVFDAFEEKQKDYKGAQSSQPPSFFSKLFYYILPEKKSCQYNKKESVVIDLQSGEFGKKSFYIRSPYRFTSKLRVNNIRSLPDVLDDQNRPSSSIDIDSRLQDNYERLLGKAWHEYQRGTKSGKETRDELIGHINQVLLRVVDIKITDLGDVVSGKGQLFFEKGSSTDFPYENLSSGEKEVVDLVIDLVVKTPDFNDTVYCIDEPELHLNTAIQRKLLLEIEKLIPDSCQLWVATHSIGFLRAIQEDLREKSQILDFSEKDYFEGTCEIKPILTTRKNWQRIFQTALEDLTGLLSPKKIIYCEGRQEPAFTGDELGLDADVYNIIFSEDHYDTLFVSSGGGGEVEKNAALALKVLGKAFTDVELYLLRDRDERTEDERNRFLTEDQAHRMLLRREIENYLFDKEILRKFCASQSATFDEARYDRNVTDALTQCLKPVQQEIQASCGASGSISDFKRELSLLITSDTKIYTDLSRVIFTS